MGKSVTSKEAMKEVEKRGWTHVRTRGDHFVYKHPDQPLLIVIVHPSKSLSLGVVRDIEKKAGFRF